MTPVIDLTNTFAAGTENYTVISSTLTTPSGALVVSKSGSNVTFGTERTFTITQSGSNHSLTFNLAQMATNNVNILCQINGNTVATLTTTGISNISLSPLATGNHTLKFVTDGNVSGPNRSFTIDDVEITYDVTSVTTTCNPMLSIGEYKYGFGGKEKDSEVSGKGNSYDFGARMYDSRLGRWLAIDPLANYYPSFSPYNYGANNPIFNIDSDGNIIEPYSKTWSFFGITWKTYPRFGGGFTGTRGEVFHTTRLSMLNTASVFSTVWSTLQHSKNYYRFQETNITKGGVSGAMSEVMDANGYFDRNHKGNSSDPYVINYNYDMLSGISGHNDKSTIFEEVFHAGQHEFYGKNRPSNIDIEVEAKVVKSLEGFGDFTYQGFDEYREAFKAGSVNRDQQIQFDMEVHKYAENISELYIEAKVSQGMSRDLAKKHYGYNAFTGDMKYGEKLYGKKLQSEGVIIIAE